MCSTVTLFNVLAAGSMRLGMKGNTSPSVNCLHYCPLSGFSLYFTSLNALCAVLACLVQDKCDLGNAVMSHKGDKETGASVTGGGAERAGAAQEGSGRSGQCAQVPAGRKQG